MKLLDAAWGYDTNILIIECCGVKFWWPAYINQVVCPLCGKKELWHGVSPRGGEWIEPTMENKVS